MIAKEFTSIDEEIFEITPGLSGFQFLKMRSPNLAYVGYRKCDRILFAQYHNGNAVLIEEVDERNWDKLQLGKDSHNVLFMEAIQSNAPDATGEMLPCSDTHERITKVSAFKMIYHYDILKSQYQALVELQTQNMVN